jgi:hypothetical protein
MVVSRALISAGSYLLFGISTASSFFSVTPQVTATPVFVEVTRANDREETIRSSGEPVGLIKHFRIRSLDGNNWNMGDVCIFEVLQATNATSGGVIDKTPLPKPYERNGNDDSWRKDYAAMTGVSPTYYGTPVRGQMSSTWNVGMGNVCPTEKDKHPGKLFGRWITNIDGNAYMNLTLEDQHGPLGYVPFDDDPTVAPLRGIANNKSLVLEGPFDIVQNLLWYRSSSPSNVYFLAGPFTVRRWFTWRWTDEGNSQCILRGGAIYEENIEVFSLNGLSLGKTTVSPPYGCARPPKGEPSTYQVPSSRQDSSKKEPYVNVEVFVKD